MPADSDSFRSKQGIFDQARAFACWEVHCPWLQLLPWAGDIAEYPSHSGSPGSDPWHSHRKQDGARQVRPLVSAGHTLPSVAIPQLELEPAGCPKALQTDPGSINRGPFPRYTKRIPNLQHTVQDPHTCPSQGRRQQLRTAPTGHPYMRGKCRSQKCWTVSHHKWKRHHLLETAASHPCRERNWNHFLSWRRKENTR